MTTAHLALYARPLRLARLGVPLLALLLVAQGCAVFPSGDRFDDPSVVRAPYDAGRDVVIAVAPLRNESGASAVDELTITDRLVESLTQVQGLVALPVNRSVGAMRSLGIDRVTTPADARQLAQQLGADGVIVGTITSWDPYDPPRLGLSLVLHARTSVMRADARSPFVDPLALQRAASDVGLTVSEDADLPVAAFAEVVDASNHAVLMDVKSYASGRHDPDTAMGWRIYTKSAMRFAQYVSHRAARSLMDSERRRLADLASAEAPMER
ncbi:MAG: hypothetical protein Tsb0013_14600 [Phycisphaerales bacterium]